MNNINGNSHTAATVPAKATTKTTSSGSSYHDDTVGHFVGGEGTKVSNDYTIVRDSGLGTFGRVVECTVNNSTLVSDDENGSRHRRLESHENDQRNHRKKTSSSASSSASSSSSASNNNVAIKIIRKVKRYHDSALIEASILRDVNRRGGRGVTLCIEMLRTFEYMDHCCLVFEKMGLSLYDFLKRNSYKPFPFFCVQDFASQLLEATEFLHSFKLIHTDLKPENILLCSTKEVSYKTESGEYIIIPASNAIKVM
jgi:CDC-like kinase